MIKRLIAWVVGTPEVSEDMVRVSFDVWRLSKDGGGTFMVVIELKLFRWECAHEFTVTL